METITSPTVAPNKVSPNTVVQKALAIVSGQALTQAPVDLYIPPDALEVILDMFEGPLDLLLYLIRKNNLDILNIPVAEITKQYVQYIELMAGLKLELAADYLEMSALLAEIKSRMLLPKPEVEEEEDPRAELVRRLQIYEQIKDAAINLDEQPRQSRETFQIQVNADVKIHKPLPDVAATELMFALKALLTRTDLESSHIIDKETMSVREKMSTILNGLREKQFYDLIVFCNKEDGVMGVVVALLAILELAKEHLIEITQKDSYTPIYLRLRPDATE